MCGNDYLANLRKIFGLPPIPQHRNSYRCSLSIGGFLPLSSLFLLFPPLIFAHFKGLSIPIGQGGGPGGGGQAKDGFFEEDEETFESSEEKPWGEVSY